MAKIGATIPGVDQVFRLEFVDTLGLLPAVGSVWIKPQASLPFAIVDVVITDGFQSITLTRCRISSSTLVRSRKTGNIVRFAFFDARWDWAFGTLNGNYNYRDSEGNIYDGRAKSVRDLATLCFEEWGEAGFDVSALPANDHPRTLWGCTPVIPALRELLDYTGTDVAIDRNDNHAHVVLRGSGALLPAGSIKSFSYGVDFGEVPDDIAICAGPTLYQSKLKLVAKAIETDGSLKDIDDVSYKPADGWEKEDDPGDLIPDQRDTPAYKLANTSIYRIYAIESQADGSQDVPDLGTIDQVEQIVVTDELVEDYTIMADGSNFDQKHRREAFLQGQMLIVTQPEGVENETEEHQILEVDFHIDKERNLVIFRNPVFRIVADELKPANLFLTCAYNVIDTDTWTPVPYGATRNLASNGTPTFREPRPEIVRRVIARYADDDNPDMVTSTEDNNAVIDPMLEAALDAVEQKFASHESTMAEYVGIVPTQLDGAIQQARYVVSRHSGANTFLYRNTESDPGALNRRERDRIYRVMSATSGERAKPIGGRLAGRAGGRVA